MKKHNEKASYAIITGTRSGHNIYTSGIRPYMVIDLSFSLVNTEYTRTVILPNDTYTFEHF